MIRTEKHPVAIVAGEVAFVNVYGFGWDAADSDNTVTSDTKLTAIIEYENGHRVERVLRPAAWYGGQQIIRRVWLVAGAAGNVVIARGDAPGDVMTLPTPPTSTAPRTSEVLVGTWPANQLLANFGRLDVGAAFSHPAWARSMTLWLESYATAKVGVGLPNTIAYVTDRAGTKIEEWSGADQMARYVRGANDARTMSPTYGLGAVGSKASGYGGTDAMTKYISTPEALAFFGLGLSFYASGGDVTLNGKVDVKARYWGTP